jgi:RNA polymerase sigma-70 factor (ECF subfamily)
MNTPADERIISLYTARDESAISETERVYGAYLLSIAKNICPDHQTALECVNDTYLSAWNAIPPDSPGSLRHYLAAIARNHAASAVRRDLAAKRCADGYLESLEELGDIAEPRDEDGRRIREVLNGYLGAVCDRDRAVFVQRYFYAVPVKKIARKVGLRPVSVYKILERMRSELRAALEKEDITV